MSITLVPPVASTSSINISSIRSRLARANMSHIYSGDDTDPFEDKKLDDVSEDTTTVSEEEPIDIPFSLKSFIKANFSAYDLPGSGANNVGWYSSKSIYNTIKNNLPDNHDLKEGITIAMVGRIMPQLKVRRQVIRHNLSTAKLRRVNSVMYFLSDFIGSVNPKPIDEHTRKIKSYSKDKEIIDSTNEELMSESDDTIMDGFYKGNMLHTIPDGALSYKTLNWLLTKSRFKHLKRISDPVRKRINERFNQLVMPKAVLNWVAQDAEFGFISDSLKKERTEWASSILNDPEKLKKFYHDRWVILASLTKEQRDTNRLRREAAKLFFKNAKKARK